MQNLYKQERRRRKVKQISLHPSRSFFARNTKTNPIFSLKNLRDLLLLFLQILEDITLELLKSLNQHSKLTLDISIRIKTSHNLYLRFNKKKKKKEYSSKICYAQLRFLPPFSVVSTRRSEKFIPSNDQTRHTITVSKTQTKKGTQKKRKYSLCKKKTLAFETFLVHLHRAVVNQDNQEI